MAKEPALKRTSYARGFPHVLVFTALLCGALIMVIEVLGSRVLGPLYGVSIFVWTSLITVTLVALACGYAAGGVFSDRKNSPDYLYGIVLVSGFLVLLIPLVKGAVLKLCLPMGLRAGSLGSAFLLFGPSLFLLGCVSPYIVRIAAREMKNIGRTVGVFYAVSTMGSVLGTVLTGFVLIAYLGVNRIFSVIGALLVFLALLYFLIFKRRWQSIFVLLALPLFFTQAGPTESRVMPDGTRATKIYEKDGFYGNLKVIDYAYGPTHTRELMIDGLIQGGMDMTNRLSVYEYTYFMEHIPYALNPYGKKCLAIGIGAGLIPRWFEERGVTVDVVDIDPAVPVIAKNYFGFRVSGDIIISDARYFLENGEQRYDYIMLDVFNGDTTPGHVLSKEAMRLLRARLAPRGVLAINLVGSIREKTFMTASVVKTVQSAFETVDVYPNFDTEAADAEGWGNITLIAYDFSPKSVSMMPGRDFPVHSLLEPGLRAAFGKKFRFPSQTPAIVLSDDYNPIDFYDLRLKENVRKNILENTDWDILL